MYPRWTFAFLACQEAHGHISSSRSTGRSSLGWCRGACWLAYVKKRRKEVLNLRPSLYNYLASLFEVGCSSSLSMTIWPCRFCIRRLEYVHTVYHRNFPQSLQFLWLRLFYPMKPIERHHLSVGYLLKRLKVPFVARDYHCASWYVDDLANLIQTYHHYQPN